MGYRWGWVTAATAAIVWEVVNKMDDQAEGYSLVRAKTRGLAVCFYKVEWKKWRCG